MFKVVLVVLGAFQVVAGISHCEPTKYSIYDPEVNIPVDTTYSVSREDVTYRLWTRGQKNFEPLIFLHLKDSQYFDPAAPVKVLIHGWSDCADSYWNADIKDEFLKKGPYNVIQVDWSKPASAWYPGSAGYTKEVGLIVADLLLDMNNTLGVPFENIHLIGHSLGAHISGFAGQNVYKNTRKLINRITGLDPAGPLFLLATANSRLSLDDAYFVDIIHTDGGKFGYMQTLGHVDFYPNRGSAIQPGCFAYDAYDIIDVASCSHTRSYKYFHESINSYEFIANECSSFTRYESGACNNNPVALMGENVDPKARGVFYLTTNSQSPFPRNGTI